MIDQLDRGILQALQLDGRAPFRRIAAALGTSEQTVARRYRRLYADGVLRVIGLVDPRSIGVTPWFVRIQCRPDAAAPLADALARRDDVAWVTLTAGGSEVTCSTRGEPGQDENELLLQRLPRTSQVLSFSAHAVLHRFVAGGADWTAYAEPFTAAQLTALGFAEPPIAQPPAPQALSPSPLRSEDGPLLQALGLDGRASYAELARSTGWSQARVAGRLDELLTSGTIYVDVELSVELLGFGTQAYLWLTVPPDQLSRVGQALSELAEVSFVAAVTGQASLLAAVVCPDTESLYRLMTERIGGIGAVQRLDVAPVIRRVKQAGSLMDGVRLTSRIAPPRRTRPAQNGGSS
jgi:DNA-binding Lrp family transcriptional regulator